MVSYLCGILRDLITDLVKIVITGGTLWSAALFGYYLKRNEMLFHKIVRPSHRVFRCINTKFEKVEILDKKFENIFNEKEQKQLLVHSTGKNIYNGDMVRLVEINDSSCYVQEIKYYDFLTTNLIFKPASSRLLSPKDALWHLLFDEEFRIRNKLENRLRSKVAWYGKLKTFDEVLSVEEFANAVAVSVVLRDNQNRILIVRRGDKNVISSGIFAVSVTGSLKMEDLKNGNPFVCAGCREVKEELNLEVELEMKEIIIVKQKYQPVALLEGRIQQSFSELVEIMKKAKGYSNENTKIYAVPQKEVKGIVRKYRFTDTSTYQLVETCNAISWIFTKKRDIHKYEME